MRSLRCGCANYNLPDVVLSTIEVSLRETAHGGSYIHEISTRWLITPKSICRSMIELNVNIGLQRAKIQRSERSQELTERHVDSNKEQGRKGSEGEDE